MNNNQVIEKDEFEIDLADLFHELLRKWWLILIVAMAGFFAAVGITKFAITPQYQSEAMLYILTKTTSVTSIADLQIGTAITRDFEIIATSKPVIDAAIENIKENEGVTFTRKEIKNMLTVANEDDTRILTITAVSDNPEYACMVANAIAEETATRMAEIMKSDKPTTVELAEANDTPVSPSMTKNAVIGFLLGAVLVCGILVLRFVLNDNIKTEEDIEKYLGEAVLVMIPYVKGRGQRKEVRK